jgi:hypothetical protein
MSLSRIIEVTVSPDGQTRIETKGFAGASCQQASRALEEALGVRQREQLTAEFYQEQGIEQSAQEGA